MRASNLLKTYGGSCWAFEDRIAVSRVAVRLCLNSVFAGRDRLGLLRREYINLLTLMQYAPQGFHKVIGEVSMP